MNKKLNGIISFAMLFALTSCNITQKSDSPSEEISNSDNLSFVISSEKTNENVYQVEVKKENQTAISNVVVNFYLNNVIAYSGTTNEDGIAYISADKGIYDLKLDNLPKGYRPIHNYTTTMEDNNISVVCNVRPYENEVDIDYIYSTGDVMHDFTYYDVYENEVNLINLLAENDLVLINFWYKDCTYCRYEMPYMEAVYGRYNNRVKILAFDPFDDDEVIKGFKLSNQLSFCFIRDYLELYNNFAVSGFPTTAVIDKKGIIRNIHTGAFQSEQDFEAYIELFINSEVEPGDIYVDDPDEPTINEPVKPNIEMPSSKEIETVVNGENFNYSYFGADGNDIEYNWPFVISDDGQSIHPSNKTYHGSYSILQTKIYLKKDEVFAFDYLTSCEAYDILYVLVDRVIVSSISGLSTKWETSFSFVADKDGEYLISFCYQKDEYDSLGDDTVYIKNLRILPSSSINQPTYILRNAATDRNVLNGFNTYATVVFNEKDGYYHVGKEDGPILLATLLTFSNFSDYTIYDFALNGFFIWDGVDYTDRLTEYARLCANNETGCACVTKELFFLLDGFMKHICELSSIKYYENKWLETCVYFQAFGTNGVELEDPNLGLAFHSAYSAHEGNDNSIYVSGPIIPRPIYSKFIPSQTGVYKIETLVDEETILFMYDDNYNEIALYDEGSRKYFHPAEDEKFADAEMYVKLYEGQTYYVGVNYYDLYQIGEIIFSIEYLGQSFANFEFCSPGYFTSEEDEFGNMCGDLIAITIPTAIGEDGYYHALNEDGTLGSIIYADFVYTTSIFDKSIMQLIDLGAFDFSLDENGDKTDLEDKTDAIKAYLKKVIRQQGDTFGCVPVDQELCELLQMLMDKYTFANVEGSWQKLCYYYHQYGE